ncbi:CPBP family intramembrane glutamic endopeptidase [Terrimonas ferruginea]|uniref:CPBP family intramembrane glutamic endopeptidase n=1 Tax=Terrimonas ferruginea TaxID=249 RepID=UPI000418A22A|nr:type II CAAX endopeptidase family protein [Terrimonas ferruginea]
MDQDAKGISWLAGFLMLICFAIAGAAFAATLGNLAWQALVPEVDIIKGMKDPAHSTASKMVQALYAVMGFLLPAIATAWFLHRKPLKLLGFRGPIMPQQAALVVLIMLAGLAASSGLGFVGHELPYPASWREYFVKLENSYNDQVAAIMGLNSPGDFIFSLVVMGFLPALCEEALFRAGLQQFLTRSTGKPWVAIIVVSILFSLVHLSGFGFFSRLFLGIVLGLIFQYTGRLWLCVLAHFVNNAIAISVVYYMKTQGKPMDVIMQDNGGSYWGLLAIPVVVILLMRLRNKTPQPASTAGELPA